MPIHPRGCAPLERLLPSPGGNIFPKLLECEFNFCSIEELLNASD